jgi:hypothetical protein
MIWYLLVVFICLIPGVLFFRYLFSSSEKKIENWLEHVLGRLSARWQKIIIGTAGYIGFITVLMIGFAGVISPGYYEFPSGIWPIYQSDIYTLEKEGLIRHPWGTWEKNSPISIPRGPISADGFFANGKSYPSGKVTILTENPKVRTFRYSVTPLGIVDPKAYVLTRSRWKHGGMGEGHSIGGAEVYDHVRSVLAYLYYEFQEKHSKELAKFYNPNDEGQQQASIAFAQKWFSDEFAKMGVKVQASAFSID